MGWMDGKKIAGMLMLLAAMAAGALSAAADEPVISDHYTFAFAIKGGISLGSYESGMNWFFVEKLRRQSEYLRAHGQDGNVLKVITGASAGGINAIVSAIRFCQQDDVPAVTEAASGNLFYQVWNVDIAELLPEIGANNTPPSLASEKFGFDDSHGIFHRQALLPSLEAVLTAMQQTNFRPGCQTHIALPITMLKNHPDAAPPRDDQPPTLRYAVPLRVDVGDDGRLRFSNLGKAHRNSSEEGMSPFHLLDDFMYLSEDADGSVPYIEVIKLALASSAFPLAFAPMKLKTCIPNRVGYCEQGVLERTFTDGGSLDNAPIGLASKLSHYVNSYPQKSDDNTLVVYLNPAHQSPALDAWLKQSGSEQATHSSIEPSGLQNYYNFLGEVLNYGMNAQYTTSIRSGGTPRMAPRNYMLAADHLMHFGAFTLESFRAFDFYVGMYDGYSAYMHVCGEGKLVSDCTAAPIDGSHVAGLDRLFHDLSQLPFKQEATFCNDPDHVSFYSAEESCTKHNQGDELATIACALCKTSLVHDDNTISYFETLKSHLPLAEQQHLKRKLGQFGEYNLLEVFSAKQLAIERARLQAMPSDDTRYQQQKNFTRAVKGMNVLSRTLSYREREGLWPRSTALSPYLRLLPDEIGIDGLNSVPYVNYHADYPLLRHGDRTSWFGDTALALAFSFDPYHVGRDNRNTSAYTSLAVAPRLHFDGAVLSSVSFGLNNYYNWKPSMAGNRRWDYGMYFDAGLATDKFHLTVIQRETLANFKNSRVTFLIGIRDVGGLTSLLGQ